MEIENYEQKYLKYKAKYQELKNSLKNNPEGFVGGHGYNTPPENTLKRNTPQENNLKNNPEGFVGGHGYTPQDNTYSYSSSDLDTSNSEDFY